MNSEFPEGFFSAPNIQPPKSPEDHVKDLLNDPSRIIDIQNQIAKEPHRASEITKEILGFGSDSAREKMLAKRKKQPYYKVGFANMIKKVLDDMIVDHMDRTFHMRDYKGKTESTLHGMITQGICYLEDHMDREGKYKEFSAQFVVRRSQIDGVDGWIKICLVDNDIVELIAYKELAISTVDDVERALKNFIDDAPVPCKRYLPIDESCPDLSIKPFTLNDKEIAHLRTIVDALPGILVASINSTRIVLLKKEPAKV